VLLLALSACSWPVVRFSSVQDAPAGRLVDVVGSRSTLLGHTRGIVVDDTWTPELADIERFEHGLEAYLRQLDLTNPTREYSCAGPFSLVWNQSHFFRQYHGQRLRQSRFLYVNFIDSHCGVLGDWRTGEEIPVSDGGACQFEVLYDVGTGVYSDFHFHHGGCA
jgi:hypothetical protein